MQVMSKQPVFVSILDQMRETSNDVADAFLHLRKTVNNLGHLDAKQRELCLIAGFTASRNEGGFRIHCTRASEAGATYEEVQHAVLLMLGSTQGLSPVVDALRWAREEFEGINAKKKR